MLNEEEEEDNTIVNRDIVRTNIIRNVCSFSRMSKYGIDRSSENADIISKDKYMKYRTRRI